MKTRLRIGLKRGFWFGLLPVTIILMGIHLLFIFRYKPVLESKIHLLVEKQTRGLYSIEFSAENTQILWGKIVLENVNIEPIQKAFMILKKDGKAPCKEYKIKIKKLVFFVNNIPELLLNGHIKISLLKLEAPEVAIKQYDHGCANLSDRGELSASPQKTELTSLEIDKIEVKEGNVLVETFVSNHWSNVFRGDNISLKADTFRWNKLENIQKRLGGFSLLQSLKTIPFSLVINKAQWWSPNRIYTVISHRLYYSSSDGVLELESSYGGEIGAKGLLPQNLGGAGINFSVQHLSFKQFNWPSLLLGESFAVKYVQVFNGEIQIMEENKNFQSRKIRLLPQAWLQKIPIPFHIEQVDFKDIRIRYWEQDNLTQKVGLLEFLHTEGVIKNIHNGHNTNTLNNNHPMADNIQMNLKSSLYGKGKILSEITFNLNPLNQAFKIHAEVEHFPLQNLNAMSIPLAQMKVQGGSLSKLIFELNADSLQSKGTVRALYKNLRIKFLNNLTQTDTKKLKAMSNFTNTFIILNDNPLMDDQERISTFTYLRDPSRSVFSYIWKSLFYGLKPIIGIIPGREKNIHRFMQRLKDFKTWDKTNQPEREKNRQNRKDKRILRQFNQTLQTGLADQIY
jgi:hypothetical protein